MFRNSFEESKKIYENLRECNKIMGYDDSRCPRYYDPISEEEFRRGVSKGQLDLCLKEEMQILRLACISRMFELNSYRLQGKQGELDDQEETD